MERGQAGRASHGCVEPPRGSREAEGSWARHGEVPVPSPPWAAAPQSPLDLGVQRKVPWGVGLGRSDGGAAGQPTGISGQAPALSSLEEKTRPLCSCGGAGACWRESYWRARDRMSLPTNCGSVALADCALMVCNGHLAGSSRAVNRPIDIVQKHRR